MATTSSGQLGPAETTPHVVDVLGKPSGGTDNKTAIRADCHVSGEETPGRLPGDVSFNLANTVCDKGGDGSVIPRAESDTITCSEAITCEATTSSGTCGLGIALLSNTLGSKVDPLSSQNFASKRALFDQRADVSPYSTAISACEKGGLAAGKTQGADVAVGGGASIRNGGGARANSRSNRHGSRHEAAASEPYYPGVGCGPGPPGGHACKNHDVDESKVERQAIPVPVREQVQVHGVQEDAVEDAPGLSKGSQPEDDNFVMPSIAEIRAEILQEAIQRQKAELLIQQVDQILEASGWRDSLVG